jgi:hypothetical protein
VFPQSSIETNALLFPMPIEFELDYEISFTIVVTIGQGCNFLWPSPFTRHAQPMLIKLDFGSPYLSHHGHLYLDCLFFPYIIRPFNFPSIFSTFSHHLFEMYQNNTHVLSNIIMLCSLLHSLCQKCNMVYSRRSRVV